MIMKRNLFLFLILVTNLFTQEAAKQEKPEQIPVEIMPNCNKIKAALWGILPGGGDFYCGNYKGGAIQATVFTSAFMVSGALAAREDFIKDKDMTVRFSLRDSIIAEELNRRQLIYTNNSIFNPNNNPIADYLLYNEVNKAGLDNSNYPIVGEASYERDIRLLGNRKFYEVNPIIEYGGKNYEYTQINKTTFMSGNIGLIAILAVPYSIYSGYREGGGGSSRPKEEESFDKLALAPFKIKYLTDWKILLVIGTSAVMINNIENVSPIFYRPLVYAPGTFDQTAITTSYMANTMVAVGEETFFRGMVNYELIKSFGPTGGILGSSALFAANHTWQGYKNVTPQFIAGIGFGMLHYFTGYDLGSSIAAHFWANIIGSAFVIRHAHESGLVGRNQQEIHVMPVLYTMKF